MGMETAGPGTDDPRVRAILDARTRRLALRRPEEAAASEHLLGIGGSLLLCAVGDERYGMELARLEEVVPAHACLPVPGAPPAMIGLTSRSGRVVSVLDLGSALGLARAPDLAAGHFLVLARRAPMVALRVDAALGITTAEPVQAGGRATGDVAGGAIRGYASSPAGQVEPDDTIFGLVDIEALLRPFLLSRSPESDRHVAVDR